MWVKPYTVTALLSPRPTIVALRGLILAQEQAKKIEIIQKTSFKFILHDKYVNNAKAINAKLLELNSKVKL